ncbi:carbohydrate-binding module family 13 protein [Hyaloscypha variabilis F]|uniref:Carbohydrate-binding module family 13 protein n=1 Tax=Hyaloscypha variabilis (strain UAMH 11265 / GT02V1 / F) TaxID=1149755 RepID=A0A2J6RFE3_HYAVF|nr:carbohydrate-binding module family 13 protein [Hyaloscypha variabilis F]
MDKEVHHPRIQPGLEVGLPPSYVGYSRSPYYQAVEKEGYTIQQPQTPLLPRICGLPTHIFWIVFALLLLVIGAALGGGLGGGLASRKTSQSSAADLPATASLSLSLSSSSSSTIETPQQQQTTTHGPYPTTTSTTSTSSSPPSSTSSAAVSTSSTVLEAASASTIAPFSTAPGTYRIINIQTNTAIDLLGGGTAIGTEIEAWAWDPNATPDDYVHQAWTISAVSANSNNVVTIYNPASSQYLTAPNGLTIGQNPSNNTQAQIFGGGPTFGPGNTYMQFTIVKNFDNSISFQSVAYQTKLLDVEAGSTANLTPIVVWEPNGGVNQRWRLLPS